MLNNLLVYKDENKSQVRVSQKVSNEEEYCKVSKVENKSLLLCQNGSFCLVKNLMVCKDEEEIQAQNYEEAKK